MKGDEKEKVGGRGGRKEGNGKGRTKKRKKMEERGGGAEKRR